LGLADDDRAWWEEDGADGGGVWDGGPVREVGKEGGGGGVSYLFLISATHAAARLRPFALAPNKHLESTLSTFSRGYWGNAGLVMRLFRVGLGAWNIDRWWVDLGGRGCLGNGGILERREKCVCAERT